METRFLPFSPEENFGPEAVFQSDLTSTHQGTYKKLNVKFKNIFGRETQFFKNISSASSALFLIYNTINRAISSRETKSLTGHSASNLPI